ncbi:MAG TPA: YxlC family protein [Symbiobacteriaceae bacterium]
MLHEGLDRLSAPVDEESPPDLGALLMLVHNVQQAQRQELLRDLMRFLAVAALILSGGLWAMLQFPLYYLVTQGVLAVGLTIGAAVWQTEGRWISRE